MRGTDYRVHRTVILAIAQLSCSLLPLINYTQIFRRIV